MKSWLRSWKKEALASRAGSERRERRRERNLRLEPLEERSLLTVVTLVAKDPIASEEPVGGQTDPGQFVVTRDVVTGSPLTVNFSFPSSYNPPAGYAAYSYDYSCSVSCTPDYPSGSFRGHVTIPADAASATVTITPYNDTALEGTEKVTMSLLTGTGL